jgi:hypothetical protein
LVIVSNNLKQFYKLIIKLLKTNHKIFITGLFEINLRFMSKNLKMSLKIVFDHESLLYSNNAE